MVLVLIFVYVNVVVSVKSRCFIGGVWFGVRLLLKRVCVLLYMF